MKNLTRLCLGILCLPAILAIVVQDSSLAAVAQDRDTQQEAEADMLEESATSNGVKLTFQCHPTLTCGATNYVVTTIENVGADTVLYFPEAHIPGINFSVTRNDRPVALTHHGRSYLGERLESNGPRPIRLEPGQSVRCVLNLTRYFDLSVPGDYKIIAEWHGRDEAMENLISIETEPVEFSAQVEAGETNSPLPQVEEQE